MTIPAQKQLEHQLVPLHNLLNNENIFKALSVLNSQDMTELNIPAIHIAIRKANNCRCIVFAQSMDDPEW